MRRAAGRFGSRALATAIALVAVLLIVASQGSRARAADSVYWDDAISIRVGSLDGTSGASTVLIGENGPRGVAIDPAADRIYWADSGSGAIRVANLDGSGKRDLFTGEANPYGVAIDPVARKIYWTSDAGSGGGAIRVGTLDGTTKSTLYGGESSPEGVTIDPAAGKIYWADDTASGAIRVGNLDGTAKADLFAGESFPQGVAIDPIGRRIYWSHFESSGSIRVGNLDGSGLPADLVTGETSPGGVAVDPAARKLYWTSVAILSGSIRVASLDPTGTPANLFAPEVNPRFLALLRTPVGVAPPQIGADSGVLTCSPGSWAPDLPGAFLYRAPHKLTYRWSRNGSEVPSGGSTSYAPSAPGSYTCKVTAANQAGSTSQTSPPRVVRAPNTRIKRAKINQRKDKATVRFKAIGNATGFQCKLKRAHHRKPNARFRRCDSPKTYKDLKPGSYAFKVRAVYHEVKDPTPARKRFRIKS